MVELSFNWKQYKYKGKSGAVKAKAVKGSDKLKWAYCPCIEKKWRMSKWTGKGRYIKGRASHLSWRGRNLVGPLVLKVSHDTSHHILPIVHLCALSVKQTRVVLASHSHTDLIWRLSWPRTKHLDRKESSEHGWSVVCPFKPNEHQLYKLSRTFFATLQYNLTVLFSYSFLSQFYLAVLVTLHYYLAVSLKKADINALLCHTSF